MRIERENCVGLVIDVQEKLVPAMHKMDKTLGHLKRLILGLQELSVPLLFTQQYSKGLGETIPDVSTLIGGFSYIEKDTFSCCDEPSFVEALKQKDVQHVIIAGIESHVCVLQTAIDLKAAGYSPVVVADCITSRSKSDVRIALQRFAYEGIMVASMESVLFELTRTSKAPEFKSISKLVK
ncbi:MAG: isochorismatase family protein [Prolixibacteraceae bacterium]|nr:isochorismatase family protein [Prolixibacteraceae bacterium]